jgi:hypothetical protein
VKPFTHTKRENMHNRSKLMLAALASALLLAAFVGSASAAHLSQSETRFRVTYSPLSFVPSFGSTVRCPVTLEGSFTERTIPKTVAPIGRVTSVTVGTCESGRARANTETLPWTIEYASFEGTLPNITAISQHLVRPSFEVDGEIFGIEVRCRYTTPSQLGINTREARGNVTSQRPGTESTTSETRNCPSGRQEGTGSVSTPTGVRILVSLI